MRDFIMCNNINVKEIILSDSEGYNKAKKMLLILKCHTNNEFHELCWLQ